MISQELPKSALFQCLTNSDLVVAINNSLYEVSSFPNEDVYLSFYGNKLSLNEVVSLDKLQEISVENQFSSLKESMINKVNSKQKEVPSKKIAELSPENFELNLFLVKLFFILNKKKFHEGERKSTVLSIDEIKSKYLNFPNFTKWIQKKFSNGLVAYKNSFFELNKDKAVSDLAVVVNNQIYSISQVPKLDYHSIQLGYIESQSNLFKNLVKYLEEKTNDLERNLNLDESIKSFIHDVKNGKAVLKKGQIFYKRSANNRNIIYKNLSPYILYERKNGKYYRFPECDVGVELRETDKGIEIHGTFPLFIGNYIHPASPITKKKFVPICCGETDSITLSLESNNSTLSKVLTVLNGIEFSVKNAYVSEDSAWAPMWAHEKQFSKYEIKPKDPGFDKNLVTNEVK